MNIYSDVTELIGKTPLLELSRFCGKRGLNGRIIGKLEKQNPGGSSKDRIALNMIREAEASGALREGGVLVEPTSGNTGVGIAMVAAALRYRAIIVMPDNMSRERRALIAAYGAELVLTSGAEGMSGAIKRAEEICGEVPGAVLMGQFDNRANPDAHFVSTGPEIWNDTGGGIDIFVAGVGSGGTITGVGRYLREKKSSVRIVAVEPSKSPVLSGGQPGTHGIPGIGAGFVPSVLNRELIDEIITVSDEEAAITAADLVRYEGLLCGVSSGAALKAAEILARRPENTGKMIVALFPDTGERYLSEG